MKYKALVRKSRGPCLSPLTDPALAMVPYYLFRSYHILGGATVARGKTSRECAGLLSISHENHFIQI
jgi:hypothetical protein